VVVGTLWTLYGTSTAFAYSAVLFVAGGLLVLRLTPVADEGGHARAQ
jgi:hypothetical protein